MQADGKTKGPGAPARPPIPTRMKRAWAQMAKGNPAAADRIFRRILDEQPAHQGAFMGRVNAARVRQDHDGALALMDAWLAGRTTDGAPPARIVMNYLELCVACGRTEGEVAHLAGPPDLADCGLNDRELLRLSAAADKLGLSDIIIAVIDRIGRMDNLSSASALRLMQMATATGQPEIAEQVRSALLTRVRPEDHAALVVAFEHQANGPLAARAAARRETGPRRDAAGARLLAQALLDAAEPHLARRYLRLCRRRWPEGEDGQALGRLLIRSCIASGRAEDARAEVAAWTAGMADHEAADARLELASALGDLDALETQLASLAGRRSIPQMELQICFARGDLAGAEALVPAVGAAMGRGRQVLAHFGVTHVGSVLNELRLWRQFGTEPAEGARAFYFAAREILDDQQPRLARLCGGVATRPPVIPRQIFQYWDSPEIPPALARIMDSWQNRPGLAYQRFDKAGATAFLTDRFDRDHARAFRLANHAAEGADFLRLCLLLAEGGIYADADDRLTGRPDVLLDHGRGLLLFRESYGALANNLICARAGHPVLDIARELALASLLGRENDGPWSKTGPGLMTRAVAIYLTRADDAEIATDLLIRPEIEMRRAVYPHIKLPYKSTPRYWDNRFGATGETITRALARAFAPAPA